MSYPEGKKSSLINGLELVKKTGKSFTTCRSALQQEWAKVKIRKILFL